MELPTNAVAPEWIEVLPIGEVVGRDGRKWKPTSVQKVLDSFEAETKQLPVDFEHATEVKAKVYGQK